MKNNIIEFKNLFLNYGTEEILKNINVKISQDESICIIGEGSSGKTTFLKSILGLVPISSGEIKINNFSLNKNNFWKENCYLDDFGVVFQKDALFDSMFVWENIVFKELYFGFDKKELLEKATTLISKVGMDKSDCYLYPSELSGGMRKRVAIARAVANRPKFLILDEPTAGLDPIKTNKIFSLIKNLSEEFNVTIIAVSSDMKGVLKYFKKIIMLRNCKVHWQGKSEIAKKSQDLNLKKILKRT